MKKRFLAILLSLTLVLALAACGGGAKYSGGTSYDQAASVTAESAVAPSEMPAGMEDGSTAGMGRYWSDAPEEQEEPSGDSGLPEGVKMIYRAGLELETNEFEQADAQIKALTKSLGGYFESQSSYTRSGGYRNASYTVRVPAARFEEFLTQIGSVCNVVRQTQSAEDVSERYYDMESRLETAKIKLDRLQELLSRAEEMEDIITLEDAISEAEYQIESLSGELRHYDALIGYSTIEVSLSEVYRVTEPETAPLTFGQRLAASFREGLRDFGESMEDFLEWLAYSWLTLVVIAAVVVVVVKLIRRGRAKRNTGEKREKRGWFRRKNKNAPASDAPENHSEQ